MEDELELRARPLVHGKAVVVLLAARRHGPSARISFKARNWLSRSGMLLRLGGTLTTICRSPGMKRSSWPWVRPLFRPSSSRGLGPDLGARLGQAA